MEPLQSAFKKESRSVHTPKLAFREIVGSVAVLSVWLAWSSVDQRSTLSTGTQHVISALVGRNFCSYSNQINGLLTC